ncbi:putative holin-like toxin [Ureibacillus massiliensis]
MLPMTTYEALTLMISFGTLIVTILALSFTFSRKK